MVIGYTSGVFDLFHIGHVRLLNNAKALCDRLIVGISTDEYVQEYKGKKPVIPFDERFEIVKNNTAVDAVIPQISGDKEETWRKIRFDIMFVGDDWYQDPKWERLNETFKELGVRIVYFPYTKNTSSTLINETLNKLRG